MAKVQAIQVQPHFQTSYSDNDPTGGAALSLIVIMSSRSGREPL